uniref:Uncharacterized protein n=1 Tax=Candidozyma auris TaxID=498019 RepID=A0A0L0NVN0_CANAR
MWKNLAKTLHKELLIAHQRLEVSRKQLEREKRRARLIYEKFQLIKQRKSYAQLDRELARLDDKEFEIDPLNAEKAKSLMRNSNDINNLKNVVTYLQSQRIHDELLVRYNPGLLMSQSENVKRTANMVGLKAPE